MARAEPGFPKSANIEKLMTKAQGQKRRAHGMVPLAGPQSAQMHSGIGSALKPAYEPIVCARKPLSEKNLVQNILKHGEWLEGGTAYKVGTGGLNIDQSRISSPVGSDGRKGPGNDLGTSQVTYGDWAGEYNGASEKHPESARHHAQGRFPANLLLSHVPGPNGCQRVGSRRVKGSSNPIQRPEGFQRFNGQDYNNGQTYETQAYESPGYADPDGLEEVPEYICAKDEAGDYICPVALLDQQGKSAGVHAARNKTETVNHKQGNKVYAGGWTPQNNNPDYYSSDGGSNCSRFFQQFHDPNPGFFRCEICDTYAGRHDIMSVTQPKGAQWPIPNSSPETANIAERNTNPIEEASASVPEIAQERTSPSEEGSNQSESKSAHNAENGSGHTPATIKSTAPQSAWDSLVEQNVQSVRSAASLCERCTTAIAQSLVRWQYDQSPEFLAGLDSIPEHKRQILRQSLALFVETLASTDTIPTTQSLKLFFGYVRDAMRHSTPIDGTGNGQHPATSKYREINTGWGGFYAPKASKRERNLGLEGMPEKRPGGMEALNRAGFAGRLNGKDYERKTVHQNNHPTVKPLSLMRYLLRLVTPENGTCLDPFAGSGTTGVAALSMGFNAILIEAEPEYAEIAERRCAHALRERVEPERQPEPAEEERWEDKRTGPEPDDLTYGEVVEKFATALSNTEEQFKDKLF